MTMSHQMKNINTKIEIIKKKKNQMEILEVKSTVTEKKNSQPDKARRGVLSLQARPTLGAVGASWTELWAEQNEHMKYGPKSKNPSRKRPVGGIFSTSQANFGGFGGFLDRVDRKSVV